MVHESARTATIIAISALALMGSAPALLSQQGDPDAVRARMHAYLSAYEQELRTLIADERLTQWPVKQIGMVQGGVFTGPMVRDSSRPRVLESEVAFVPLPGNAGWLGYRDVVRVGGQAVRRKGPSLVDLLRAQTDDAQERAMRLLLESARHNLGAPRTINLPSLPLELLHVRNQARFVIELSSHDRLGGCNAMRLDLVETVRPTKIQRPGGGNMPSRIAAWVEPETGRLCRAEVRTKDEQLGSWFEAVVRVDFRHDPALGLSVPITMEEVFFNPPRGRGEGEANYSNYRRFTTSGRVLPPQPPDGRGSR